MGQIYSVISKQVPLSISLINLFTVIYPNGIVTDLLNLKSQAGLSYWIVSPTLVCELKSRQIPVLWFKIHICSRGSKFPKSGTRLTWVRTWHLKITEVRGLDSFEFYCIYLLTKFSDDFEISHLDLPEIHSASPGLKYLKWNFKPLM